MILKAKNNKERASHQSNPVLIQFKKEEDIKNPKASENKHTPGSRKSR
jgi:hypothetical protein